MTDCTAYVPRAETSTAPICGNCTGMMGCVGVCGCGIIRMPGWLLVSVGRRCGGSGAGPEGGDGIDGGWTDEGCGVCGADGTCTGRDPCDDGRGDDGGGNGGRPFTPGTVTGVSPCTIRGR